MTASKYFSRKEKILSGTDHPFRFFRNFLCWTSCREKSCQCCLKDPNKELKGLPTIFLPLPSLPPLNLSPFFPFPLSDSLYGSSITLMRWNMHALNSNYRDCN